MKPFLFLFVAIVCEVLGTTALKMSAGFTRLLPSLVVVVSYGAAFYLLSLSLRHMPLGTVYALWSGLGTVGAFIIGVLLWHESLDAVRILGVVLIVVGVVLLNAFAGQSAPS